MTGSIRKTIISIITALMVMVSGIAFAMAVTTETSHAATHTIKSTDTKIWPKLTCGNLTKKQVCNVLDVISIMYCRDRKATTKTRKQWNLELKRTGGQIISNDAKSYLTKGCKCDERYLISAVNKRLKFAANFTLKKNRKYTMNDNVLWRTGDKYVCYYGGMGTSSSSKITSATYDSKKMNVKFTQYYAGELYTKYEAVLYKQSNGKYKLDKIITLKKYNPKF